MRASLGLITLISGACATGPSFEGFVERVEHAAGPAAAACGVVSFGESRSRARALNCVSGALEAQAAFWAVFQVQGIDSKIFVGYAAPRPEAVMELAWDSDAYGGGGKPFVERRWVSLARCDSPRLAEPGEHEAPIVCDDENNVWERS